MQATESTSDTLVAPSWDLWQVNHSSGCPGLSYKATEEGHHIAGNGQRPCCWVNLRCFIARQAQLQKVGQKCHSFREPRQRGMPCSLISPPWAGPGQTRATLVARSADLQFLLCLRKGHLDTSHLLLVSLHSGYLKPFLMCLISPPFQLQDHTGIKFQPIRFVFLCSVTYISNSVQAPLV